MKNETVKVSYTLYNGKAVDVTLAQAHALRVLNRYEYLNERRETRRHQSLDYSQERGYQFVDIQVDIDRDYIKQEEREYLHNALKRLNKPRRELITKVFLQGRLQTDIAKKMRVTKAAVQNKLARIYKQIRKYLK